MDEYLAGLNLTPGELNKVMYHRANMANPGRDAEGNPLRIEGSALEEARTGCRRQSGDDLRDRH